MKKVNLLSRAEMKKVMGGTEPIDFSDKTCLWCQADEVAGDCWYRRDTTADAMSECEKIYPNGSNIVANYSTCAPGCHMN